MKTWTDKQKKAFIEIQNKVYTVLELSNIEVAEMHIFPTEEDVFSLFQFQTSMWMDEFAYRDKHKNK